MKFLSKKKQHETMVMLASLVCYSQIGDTTMYLDKMYDLILGIALNVGGPKGMMELIYMNEAINRHSDQMAEIFNAVSSNSIEKDDNNDGLPN